MALILALLSQPALSGWAAWECPVPEPVTGTEGLAGYVADGCGLSGDSGNVLLPCRFMYVPVPPGSSPVLAVEARGAADLGPADISSVRCVDGLDAFRPVDPEGLPSEWGELAGVTVFRGFPLARVRLYPVTVRDGRLIAARELLFRVDAGAARPPARVGGEEGALLRAICGTDRAWREPRDPGRGGSPFAGLPWARVEIDTAGIYAVTGSSIPEACGAPSATLAMFTGRGRQLSETAPWAEAYEPLPVPISVSDGGDGVFDEGDSLFFFARGTSWWEESPDAFPDHFLHQYASLNCCWLTWGGEPGARMPVFDAGLTGAQQMPGRYLSRHHFEEELARKPHLGVPGDWVWDSALGTGTQWFYHQFSCGSVGDGGGYARVSLYPETQSYGEHHVRILINGIQVLDTLWTSNTPIAPVFPVQGLKDGSNTLSLAVIHNSEPDDIYMDWFEVFANKELALEGQTHVPVEWYDPRWRFRVDWQGSLSGCRVFAVGGDTLAMELDLAETSAFEMEFPQEWQTKGFWIVPQGTWLTPHSVGYCEPGGIAGGQWGGEHLYIAPDRLLDEAASLLEPGSSSVLIRLEDVYDEFDGGLRDPQAIRIFLDHVLDEWDPVPVTVTLCGGGHFDPRNRLSSRPSLIDPVEQSEFFSDDIYAVVDGSDIPQFAMSRIATTDPSEVGMVAERTSVYRSGLYGGVWQTRAICIADDERSSKWNTDETFHTLEMESIIEGHFPQFLRPVKHYLIFYGFNTLWKKPEARADLIDLWTDGALMVLYMGHGAFDQLADEGVLYLEDTGLLNCSMRLPVAIFGSCSVGEFQDPAKDCIAQSVTTAPGGGAIVGIGATTETSAPPNEVLLSQFVETLTGGGLSCASALLAAKLQAGFSWNDRVYTAFGDGAVDPLLPSLEVGISADTLLTGEPSGVEGECPLAGLLLAEAFESCWPDTYYTFRQQLPIPYYAPGGMFFTGSAPASPDFSFDVFTPVDARTGGMGRITTLLLSPGGSQAGVLYPHPVAGGSPSPADTSGPEIELWIDGFRNVEEPQVSGGVTVAARLADSSGIDLLGHPGRQLALYVDGSPMDVSDHFSYDQGSTTQGGLEVDLGVLPEGPHGLVLKASDCLLNRSSESLDFTVVSELDLAFAEVFAYPCPATSGVSLNWSQSSEAAVDVEIYTVTGRRVFESRNRPCTAGYNQFWWDCEDGDGDPVASGSYIFRISSGGSEALGVLALVR